VFVRLEQRPPSLVWPPPRPSMAAAFAATFLPAYDPADWANNYERRAAAQQREQQYMGDRETSRLLRRSATAKTDCRDRLHDLARPNRGGSNSTHIHGTPVPVEEPSTESTAEVELGSHRHKVRLCQINGLRCMRC
jgi:hypothetical protein